MLRSALDRLATGHGTTLVVLGEAGVGKSRLVREAAADAGARRVPVLIGRAVERDSPNALRPLAEALFSHLRRSGPPQAPELAPFRPILGRLIPEWRLPGEPAGEVSLVVLGEAVLRVLAAVNGGVGCVLVLEDLHWADADTVEVVEYLADNVADQPILCLISLRDEEPSLALSRVHDLAARRSASLLQLRRLTTDEVSEVAAGCLGGLPVPAALVEALVTRADGLPFLVEELLAAMVQAGELRKTAEGWMLDRSFGCCCSRDVRRDRSPTDRGGAGHTGTLRSGGVARPEFRLAPAARHDQGCGRGRGDHPPSPGRRGPAVVG